MKTLTQFIAETLNTKAPSRSEKITNKVQEVIGTIVPTEKNIYEYFAGLYSFLCDASKFLEKSPTKKQVEDLFNILRAQQEACPITLTLNDEEQLEVVDYDDIKHFINWDEVWKIFNTPGFISPMGSGWFGYQFMPTEIEEISNLVKDKYAEKVYKTLKDICKENNINL